MTSRRFLILVGLVLCLAAAPLSAAPNRWTPFGLTGGPVDSVVIDPAHPTALWMASAGTVYASTDGGASWNVASSGLEGQGVRFLALDPGQANVLYAASGQPMPSGITPGIFRSRDAGAHWTRVASVPQQSIWSLAVAPGPPGAPGVVFAGTDRQLLRSRDGGATFQAVIDRTAVVIFGAVAPDPQHPGTVYAVARDRRSKSIDFGATWADLDETPGHRPPTIGTLVLAPSDPQTLYETGNGDIAATWRSRNGGVTWDGPVNFVADALAVDPADPFTVYGGALNGIYVSHDGGVTWALASAGLETLTLDNTTFYGVHAFATAPGRGGFMLAATGRGLFETDDAGATWHPLKMQGVFKNPIESFRTDPFDASHWVLRSLGSWMTSRDGGFTYAPLPAAFPRIRINAVEFDPFVRGRLWAAVVAGGGTDFFQSQLYVSNDGGATWTRIPGTIPDGPLLLAPAPGTLLMAGAGIFRSTDGGHTWAQVQSSVIGSPDSGSASFLYLYRLVRDPRTARTVYALGQANQAHTGSFPAILRSDDAGLTWRVWSRTGQSIAFDPSRPRATYITAQSKLLVTEDDGKHFRMVGDLGLKGYPWVHDLIFDRRLPKTLYAATEGDGIRRSRDGGVTWEKAAPGLPASPVSTVVQDPLRLQRFYATPALGGLWRADFTQ
jgi:photosystem II stability/assembly factor-like uncharacterized protein